MDGIRAAMARAFSTYGRGKVFAGTAALVTSVAVVLGLMPSALASATPTVTPALSPVSPITYGSSITTLTATVAGTEVDLSMSVGTIDPTGSVDFGYCYDPASTPATCTSPTSISAGVSLVDGTSWDGTATAQAGPWKPLAAGYYLIKMSYGGDSVYGAASNTTALTVAKKSVDVSVQIANKAYDGTNAATITGCTVDSGDVESGDTVTCTTPGVTAAFTSTGVGTGIAVNLTGSPTIGGTDGDNYTLGTALADMADITSAPSSIAFTGSSYNGASTVKLEGTVQSACKAGADVTFDLDLNGDGFNDGLSYTVGANSAGVATQSVVLPAGTIADVRVSVAAGYCDYAEGYGIVIVAGSGDASNGGGAYNNPGRVNFGYTLQQKYDKRTLTTTVSGRILWSAPGKVRAIGRVTGYTKVDGFTGSVTCPSAISGTATGTCALITGSVTIYTWDDVDLEWDLAATNVAFRVFVVDGGTSTTCLKKSGSCTTNLKSDWFAMSIPTGTYYGESSDLYPIKGGNIVVK